MGRREITLEHNGTTYYGQVMTVKSTSLGMEDHGIQTAYLHMEGDGSGIGVGGYCLDEPVKDEEGHFVRRQGTAYGLDHVMALMQVVGVGRWEQLPGKAAIVLYDGPWPHLGRTAAGLAHITDEARVLILKEHADEWKARESEAVSA